MVWTEINHRWVLASPSLGRALVLSLLLHAFVFIGIEFGRVLGWWNPAYSLLGRSAVKPHVPREMIVVEFDPARPKSPEAPLTFVEVTPSQASSEPPTQPKYYSERNSRAANPDTTIDSNIPKVTGTQDKVPKTFDTPRAVTPPAPPNVAGETKPEVLQQPAPPSVKAFAAPEPSREQPERRSEPDAKGNLLLAKANASAVPSKGLGPSDSEVPSTDVGSRARLRPRRLASVQPQDTASIITGEKMKQSGGVRRYGIEPSFDVKFTEFGAYDKAIIAAIQKRWYDLLEDHDLPRNQIGKVVLEFHLTSKGHIIHMTETESEVSPLLGLLCRRAVEEPEPYAEWPMELRRLVGRDYREVRFVFHYN